MHTCRDVSPLVCIGHIIIICVLSKTLLETVSLITTYLQLKQLILRTFVSFENCRKLKHRGVKIMLMPVWSMMLKTKEGLSLKL